MNLGVIFGGKSVESDISVLTAVDAMGRLSSCYTVYPIFIDGDGVWNTAQQYRDLRAFTSREYKIKSVRCTLVPGDNTLYDVSARRMKPIARLDCVLNACHGGDGEKGVTGGIFRASGIPVTGCDALTGSVGMNKHAFKTVLRGLGVEHLPHMYVAAGSSADYSLISYPVIVKPVSLGSSIAVSKADCEESLRFAVAAALRYDEGVIIEPLLKDFIEINCAAVRDGDDVLISECERPITDGDYLSFADKYVSGGKFTGQANAERIFPADIPAAVRDEVRRITEQLYVGLNLKGVVRTDFLVSGSDVFVNEINTVPGSFANYLFPFDYTKLLDMIIDEAVSDMRKQAALVTGFSSGVLRGAETCPKNTCKITR